ncbi:Mis12 protein-domain-containing protein [Hypomontagnella submonticulosa]|nr:Mis12 protein-domain-containing protein [Hypomontagnella submonticulosa]
MATITSDTELLTEHFGYPPVSLIDDIINSINILAERALNSVEQGLLNAPPASLGFKPPRPSKTTRGGDGDANQNQPDPAEAAKMEIESGTHQLETLLCASIDRNFDKFEIYVLRNILCVRPVDVRNWMRLSHYEGLDLASVNCPNTPTLDTINHLRRKLRESMRLNALLAAERARNEALLAELRDLVGATDTQIKAEKPSPSQQQSSQPQPRAKQSPFAFLHNKGTLPSGGSEAPLSTTTAFTLSQLQALRALSTSLRRLAPELLPPPSATTTAAEAMDIDDDNGGGSDGKARKSWRRERLEYVEGATRRYLETVEGLELGRHGEVRDGEWQGGGRNLEGGEVGGMESVVAILGGGPGGDATAAASAAAKQAARQGAASSSRDDRMDES